MASDLGSWLEPGLGLRGGRSELDSREFTKPGRQRQPERHLIFCKGGIVSVRSHWCFRVFSANDLIRPRAS